MIMRSAVKSLLWLCAVLNVFAQDPVVNLRQGRIVGIKTYTKNSVTPIEIYLGIPYAIPPIGRYRFSSPEKHPGWSRTFFAHRMPARCPQISDGTSENYNEDCLYLNIWTVRHAKAKPLSVVVILYSESWAMGGINLPCQELAAEGFIVITIAYRLHLLSFFTLRSQAARGNLALLDQYLALLWVRENIGSFGGDPNSVTLFGYSAGADSILHHIVSPRAAGLFQRAIIMSPQYIWKALDKEQNLKTSDLETLSRDAARLLGCDFKSDSEILSCMRARPVNDFVTLSMNSTFKQGMQPSPDNFLPDSEQYLPDMLATALSSSKQAVKELDILFGTTDLEFINYNDEVFMKLQQENSSFLTSYFEEKTIPQILKKFSLDEADGLPMMIQTIRWEFFKNNYYQSYRKTPETREALFRLETSAKWGAGGALLAARLARLVTRLFVYRFEHRLQIDLYGRLLNFSGAAHGADLISLLGDALLLQVARRPPSPQDRAISTQYRNYLGNFIKYGTPATENIWPRYRVGDAYMHNIPDEDLTKCRVNGLKNEAAFWLQYLPELSRSIALEKAEKLIDHNGESRLCGGVFAMSGVTAVLLLLLCACAILLRRARIHRAYDAEYDVPKSL